MRKRLALCVHSLGDLPIEGTEVYIIFIISLNSGVLPNKQNDVACPICTPYRLTKNNQRYHSSHQQIFFFVVVAEVYLSLAITTTAKAYWSQACTTMSRCNTSTSRIMPRTCRKRNRVGEESRYCTVVRWQMKNGSFSFCLSVTPLPPKS